MKASEFCELAGRLMRCPAVPYHEAGVRAEAERICVESGLLCQRDRFGNLLVRLRTGSRIRPLVLAAHLDHPGFNIERPVSSGRWSARFLGGVPADHFRSGIALRLLPGARPAVLGKSLGADKQFIIEAGWQDRSTAPLSLSSPPPQFAVWELPDFAVRRGRIVGRSCDDLIGVSAILATLVELKRSRARVHVVGVISRAEEIGFQGALAVAASKALSRDSLIISLETSRELPPVKMGSGVIIRVGDRASVFDAAATRFLCEVAQRLAAQDSDFRFQRALMSGGTCEATAYSEFGYQTGAVCVALGNYHNCGPGKKIAAEFVDVSDACGMVQLLSETARQMPHYGSLVARLPQQLKELLKSARKNLRSRVRPAVR